ncbi:MAG: hypothetical protein IT462_04480 [Planctomycetes bacterium]|nr:hypothetical protein [Planctomycetota bacterium]
MLRFQFDPPAQEPFAFDHYSIEGNNSRGFALLGWNNLEPGEDPEGKPMLQQWFETLGDAMRFAQDKLGISKGRWEAPIGKSGSGRVAPPVPPRLKDTDPDE